MVWSCIGPALFGLIAGYLFAWSTKQNAPSLAEVVTLLGTATGGGAISFLSLFDCAERLTLYLMGIVIGYILYLVAIWIGSRNQSLPPANGAKGMSLMPWQRPK